MAYGRYGVNGPTVQRHARVGSVTDRVHVATLNQSIMEGTAWVQVMKISFATPDHAQT